MFLSLLRCQTDWPGLSLHSSFYEQSVRNLTNCSNHDKQTQRNHAWATTHPPEKENQSTPSEASAKRVPSERSEWPCEAWERLANEVSGRPGFTGERRGYNTKARQAPPPPRNAKRQPPQEPLDAPIETLHTIRREKRRQYDQGKRHTLFEATEVRFCRTYVRRQAPKGPMRLASHPYTTVIGSFLCSNNAEWLGRPLLWALPSRFSLLPVTSYPNT